MTNDPSDQQNEQGLPAFFDEADEALGSESRPAPFEGAAPAAAPAPAAQPARPTQPAQAAAAAVAPTAVATQADPAAAGHPMLGAAPLEEYRADVGSIASFLPDTPWTTTAVHACERRRARAWVDSMDMPQNVAVLVPGDPDNDVAPTAYLFGSEAEPDSLVRFVHEFEGAVDVICDDTVGIHVAEALPQLVRVEHSVHWFERLDTVERPDMPGLRRLRLRDESVVGALTTPGLLRTFETVKDVLMVGGASGVVADGEIQSAAYTVDQTVNYARVFAVTGDAHVGKGLGEAATRHIVASHHEQGRLACTIVRAGDEAAARIVHATGFESAARMTVFQKR